MSLSKPLSPAGIWKVTIVRPRAHPVEGKLGFLGPKYRSELKIKKRLCEAFEMCVLQLRWMFISAAERNTAGIFTVDAVNLINAHKCYLHSQDWDRGLGGGGNLQYHLQPDHHVPSEYFNSTSQRPLYLLHQLPHAPHLLVWAQCRPGGGGEFELLNRLLSLRSSSVNSVTLRYLSGVLYIVDD